MRKIKSPLSIAISSVVSLAEWLFIGFMQCVFLLAYVTFCAAIFWLSVFSLAKLLTL